MPLIDGFCGSDKNQIACAISPLVVELLRSLLLSVLRCLKASLNAGVRRVATDEGLTVLNLMDSCVAALRRCMHARMHTMYLQRAWRTRRTPCF